MSQCDDVSASSQGTLLGQQEEENRCEAPNCSRPGMVCPDCEHCYCWQHLRSSTCDTCRHLFYEPSIEDYLARMVGIGLSIVLSGILVLLLPRESDSFAVQLAISLFIVGGLLFWVGLLARS